MMAAVEHPRMCECDLRHRAWNPNTGRCETCGARFEDRRGSQLRVSDHLPTKECIVAPEESS